MYGFWPHATDDSAMTAWVKGCSNAMSPYAMAGEYVNFLGSDDTNPLQKALTTYGPDKFERLMALKRRYDPENVFRINHNIPPG